jgi:hypothetical protein
MSVICKFELLSFPASGNVKTTKIPMMPKAMDE